jgi:uroporphyrinogen-III synthase
MRVLVTRPEPGASATSSRLRERGFEPVLLPLSRTEPVVQGDMPEPDRFDAVVLTSANAIRYAPAETGRRYGHLPCLAVGDRTAEAAAKAGFSQIESADGDVRSLTALVEATWPAGSRLLYLCGQRRRPELERELGALGYEIVVLETYRTEPTGYSPSEVEQLVGSDPVGAVLLYSPFAAERLSALAAQPGLSRRFATTRILCMSAQIRAGLPPSLHERAETAESPDEEALLALLSRAG